MIWVEEDVRHHTTRPLQNKHLVAAVWSKDLEQNLIWQGPRQGPRHVAHGDTKNTSHGSYGAQSIWEKNLGSRIEGSDTNCYDPSLMGSNYKSLGYNLGRIRGNLDWE